MGNKSKGEIGFRRAVRRKRLGRKHGHLKQLGGRKDELRNADKNTRSKPGYSKRIKPTG